MYIVLIQMCKFKNVKSFYLLFLSLIFLYEFFNIYFIYLYLSPLFMHIFLFTFIFFIHVSFLYLCIFNIKDGNVIRKFVFELL